MAMRKPICEQGGARPRELSGRGATTKPPSGGEFLGSRRGGTGPQRLSPPPAVSSSGRDAAALTPSGPR
eukprot:6523513-Prymnesium_polylepis.1